VRINGVETITEIIDKKKDTLNMLIDTQIALKEAEVQGESDSRINLTSNESIIYRKIKIQSSTKAEENIQMMNKNKLKKPIRVSKAQIRPRERQMTRLI